MKQLRGFWQQIPSTTISEILCNTDLDFVCLDTEHGVFNEETIFSCIQVITLSGKKAFIRVTEANKTLVRHYLDAGVDGIIFSTVEDERVSADHFHSEHNAFIDEINWINSYIDNIWKQTNFPNRGYGLTRDNFWGERARKEKPLVIAQMESVAGINQIGGFTTYFDYFLVGPYDLSSSLGCPGDFENKEFKKQIQNLKNTIGIEKMGYHIVKDIDNQITDLKDCGILAFSLDTLMLIDGVKKVEDILKVSELK
jgi:2-dehydro-3-deoxyglucarate aldolase